MEINVKHPCRSCVYFDVCGSSTRTETCKGRMTKKEQQRLKALKEEVAICPDDEYLYEEMADLYQSIGEIKGALLEMADIDGLDDPYEAFND